MTIPNETSEIVRFNPLIKLKKSIIKDEPVDEIQKQFFQKHLFNTLNNKILSSGYGEKEVTLEEATKKDYVSNNVKLTIDTLFPDNGILYIGGQPYTIYDVDFDKKAWAMQPKDVIEHSLQSRDWLKSNLVQQQTFKGMKELETIPKELKEGPKYVSVKTIPDYSPDTSPSEQKKIDETTKTKTLDETTKTKTLDETTKTKTLDETTKTKTLDETTKTKTLDETQVSEKKVKRSRIRAPKEILPEYVTIPVSNNNWKQEDAKAAQNMRNYFKQSDYYDMLHTMQDQDEKDAEMFALNSTYINKSRKTRKMRGGVLTRSQTFQHLSYDTDSEETELPSDSDYGVSTKQTRKHRHKLPDGRLVFNDTNYNKLVNKLQIIPNGGGGDCFFSAVADGINIYNANAPADEKISAQCFFQRL